MDERGLKELEIAEVANLYGMVGGRRSEVGGKGQADSVVVSTSYLRPPTADLDLASLRAAAAACRACSLCEHRKQAVFGVGAENAKWMFIGEGPGADEDEQGDPFVGQAGKLLDGMLAAIGIRRGREVYIANVVKCRPPGNRTPTADEAAACAPFLDRQIELIAPKLIVALGKTAAMRLLNTDSSLSGLRGRVHSYRGVPLVVTYHPAYLLRSLPEKSKAWEDLLFARRSLQAGGSA